MPKLAVRVSVVEPGQSQPCVLTRPVLASALLHPLKQMEAWAPPSRLHLPELGEETAGRRDL